MSSGDSLVFLPGFPSLASLPCASLPPCASPPWPSAAASACSGSGLGLKKPVRKRVPTTVLAKMTSKPITPTMIKTIGFLGFFSPAPSSATSSTAASAIWHLYKDYLYTFSQNRIKLRCPTHQPIAFLSCGLPAEQALRHRLHHQDRFPQKNAGVSDSRQIRACFRC